MFMGESALCLLLLQHGSSAGHICTGTTVFANRIGLVLPSAQGTMG
jgi:hypothetical protein